jgi:hypothetical protein
VVLAPLVLLVIGLWVTTSSTWRSVGIAVVGVGLVVTPLAVLPSVAAITAMYLLFRRGQRMTEWMKVVLVLIVVATVWLGR